MKKATIVGAGLSGLTAAITLARDGWEVDMIERRDQVGGAARDMETGEMTYVMVDGTPMELDKLTAYLGFDISPATRPMNRTTIHCFGKRYDVTFPANVPSVLVERGMRVNSLDYFLYGLAKDAGVNFIFDTPVKTKKDFAELPPDTILATGLFRDTYDAIGVPYARTFGYMAFGTMENYGGPPVIIYMDKYTRDYAFFSTINGMGGALIFQRDKPLTEEAKRWFPRQLSHDEGIEFVEWRNLDVGVLPAGSLHNPRLFQDRFILTGTLAGMQDPVLLFGVHGALVSGKIAALALTDREAALKQFKRVNALWQLSYINRKLVEATFPYGLHYGGRAGLDLQPYYEKWLLRYVFALVPGWLRV
jgi:flavin-dependent dehydrogenase